MGKKQHQKDKLYLTTTEWSTIYGGRQANQSLIDGTLARAQRYHFLRFDQCALSLQSFKNPYCTRENGIVYDLEHIVPFLKRHGIDPSTGKPLTAKQLVKLNYHKDKEGNYHCPVMFKRFTENSHIVAIATSGNVLSYEAVEQLNLKTNNFRDLLTDEPFTKKDIITIQDPHKLTARNISTFHHILNKLKWDPEDEDAAGGPSSSSGTKSTSDQIKSMNMETRDTLKALEKGDDELKADREKQSKLFGWSTDPSTSSELKTDSTNAAIYSTGTVSAGLTSTVMAPETSVTVARLDEDLVRYKRVKKKGYVQLQTNLGNLNFELYCGDVPKACDNFILLCRRGYYDGTVFHRLIKNFMVQGGDPTGTGRGGESAWEGTFKDEFRAALCHDGRGVLSMANSGPDTNKSQFYITFRSCRHLDRKHTVFGKLVGGMDTLNAMERIPTNSKDDRPKEEIQILKTVVFTDPFSEVDEQLAKERAEEASQAVESKNKTDLKRKTADDDRPGSGKDAVRSGVGAFIKLSPGRKESDSRTAESDGPMSVTAQKKAKKTYSSTFGNFSSW